MQVTEERTIKVALAGLGVVGRAVARELDRGSILNTVLAAVAVRDHQKAAAFIDTLEHRVPIIPIQELAKHADIVIECAPAALLGQIAEPVLRMSKRLIVLSVGALLSNPTLKDMAIEGGGKIMVPTGALLGLDAVMAAAEGTIHSVRMITHKPPEGLRGAPYLEQQCTNLEDLVEPVMVFKGTARDAAVGFPANLNVAVALSLAGVGPDNTFLEIWANPHVTRNTHTIEVDSDSAKLTMTIENVPSENPKTGVITARSVLALLRKISAPIQIGT